MKRGLQFCFGFLLPGFLMLSFPFSCLSQPVSDPDAFGTKRILILHSFHKGQKWNDDLSQGIVDGFDREKVELMFEYMDAKHHFDERHYANLRQLYRHKYRLRPVDVIISTDEDALDFLLRYRDDLFPGTPVVFCGVKYLDENTLYGERNITGVIEKVDIDKTIQLILELMPRVKQVEVIADNSPTSISTIKAFIPVLRKYRHQLGFHFNELTSLDTLQHKLSTLSMRHAVLLISFTQDIDGVLYSMKESARTIAYNSPVPVFALWDSYLGEGILGGLLVSGYSQGQIASGIARKILQGEKVEQLPVLKSTAGRYMFDYRQLERFRLSEQALPTGSTVINRPVSFYYQYKKLIFTVVFGILSLALIILVLSINIVRRRRVEESLKKTSQRLTLMHEIDKAILNAFSIEIVAEKLMSPIQQVFGCELTGILLIEKGNPQAKALVRCRLAEETVNREIIIPLQEQPLNRLERGEPLFSPDHAAELRVFSTLWQDTFPGAAYLLTPLIYRESLLGGLLLGSATKDLSDASLRRYCWEVADSLAVVAQNKRLLNELREQKEELKRISSSILETQESERKRLSIELHDEFGQTLTAVGLNLSLIRNKLGPEPHSFILEKLDQTEEAIENLYDQIHNLSLDLHPMMLDDLGLLPTVRWYLNQFQERSVSKVSFEHEGNWEKAIPGPVAVALYRILQEALTNIAKYAQASLIQVRLITAPGKIQLIVDDNGVGFNPEEVLARKAENRGLGLLGMRERLDLLHGSLTIDTTHGRGTTLHAVVPLEEISHVV